MSTPEDRRADEARDELEDQAREDQELEQYDRRLIVGSLTHVHVVDTDDPDLPCQECGRLTAFLANDEETEATVSGFIELGTPRRQNDHV